MDKAKRTFHVNPILLVLILGLVAFIIYVYFYVNPTQVIGTLSKTNLPIYSSAFLAYILFAVFSSLVWHELLNSLSVKVTKRKTFLLTWVGLFFDATIPQLGWSGEVSKTYLLTKDSNVDVGKIGASVVGQKIFTMTITIVALSTGLGLVLTSYHLPLLVTMLIGSVLCLSILALAIVYYISIKPAATKTLLSWATKIVLFLRKKWNPLNFQLKAEAELGKFHAGIKQLTKNPRTLVKPAVCAVFSFIFEVSVISISFIALGFSVPIDKVLIVFTLTGTLQTVGVTFFGFPELIMTISFNALLIPTSLALSVTLLARVVNLWFRLIVSYSALQLAGIRAMRQNWTS